MTKKISRSWRATVSLTLAALLVGSGTAALADDEPSTEERLENARSAEAAATMSLAEIEAELEALSVRSYDLQIDLANADAAKLEAQADLNESLSEAIAAQEIANEALADLEAARDDLGTIGAAMYRDSSAAVPMASYLSSSSVTEAAQKQYAYDRLGQNASDAVAAFEAARIHAEALQDQAEEKADAQAEAAARVDEAYAAAERASSAVDAQLAEANSRRDALLTEVAQRRGTTLALEQERQAEIDQERERQAEIERQAILDAAAQDAAAREAATAARSQTVTENLQANDEP